MIRRFWAVNHCQGRGKRSEPGKEGVATLEFLAGFLNGEYPAILNVNEVMKPSPRHSC